MQDILELGAPRMSLVEQAERDSNWEKFEAFVLPVLAAYDKLAIPDVDVEKGSDLAAQVIKALASAARKIKAIALKKTLVTADLLSDLGDVRTQLRSWIKYLSKPQESAVLGGVTRRKLYEIARFRLAEAEDYIEALERRQANKIARKSKPVPRPKPENTMPPFHLDITAVEGDVGVIVGGKVSVFQKANASLTAGAEAKGRRISLRYQSYVPGVGDRRLLCSQQTVINYRNYKAAIEGLATGEKDLRKERSNLVTMSYRSVLVNWFDDLQQNNQSALPNGSGVSFGMSVLAESFADYARACKMMVKPPPGKPVLADLGDDLKKLETAMIQQLKVTAEELRAFMRQTPSGTGDVTLDPKEKTLLESYLVESAFAFTNRVDLKSNVENHRPKALFDLAPVKALMKTADRGQQVRLQSIRLRFRLRHDDDKSRSLIKLGWNPEPWGEGWGAPSIIRTDDPGDDPWYVRLTGWDPKLPDWLKMSSLALQFGIGVERVRRAGSEGIVELSQRLFPDPYNHKKPPDGYGRERAQTLEEANHRSIADMLVPPVALFSH